MDDTFIKAAPERDCAHRKGPMLEPKQYRELTIEEAARAAAVWMMPESLAARAAQQKKLGKETFPG